MRSPVYCLSLLAALPFVATQAPAAEVTVGTSAELRAAAAAAVPGTTILLRPGVYEGDVWLTGLVGEARAHITIRAADPNDRPRFVGGGEGLHVSEAAYLTLADIEISGASGNGLNIDDGGKHDAPAHDIRLMRLYVSDIGPHGNRDGIKLSGVDHFFVWDCLVERWGDGGSAIDMVGCHWGEIEACTFRGGGMPDANGVQMKGGSLDVTVHRCTFIDAGSRAVNIGGSTGLQFFRPKPQGYEAKDIIVEDCAFVGGQAAVAFVGVDGAKVHHNTIYHPGRWATRILQETTAEGFVPCRNGVFRDNIIVFRSDQWAEGGVNIGPNTAPETFRFEGNLWFCEDRPEASAPSLPVPEGNGLVGVDPLLVDPENGDFTLREGSPAEGKGGRWDQEDVDVML